MRSFIISPNECLDHSVDGFYHCDYVGWQKPGNPDFINNLKNQFGSTSDWILSNSTQKLRAVLDEDLPQIAARYNRSFTVLVIPRAHRHSSYRSNQLRFRETIREFVNSSYKFYDGIDAIVRVSDTRTTHMKNYETGPMPYQGITEDTCRIDASMIRGKDILLIDDIYTKTVNIDEDCLQAIFNCSPRSVVFYAVAKTKGWYD